MTGTRFFTSLKRTLANIPIIGRWLQNGYHRLIAPPKPFTTSAAYWQERYATGGNSGDGSYDLLAQFKAEVINSFVADHQIHSIIEYGCGDGNQLILADYPTYMGFDVSPEALKICHNLFAADKSKSFKLMKEYGNETADLTLSLDVLYHLIEDTVFNDYMALLFNSATRYVIIYSSNHDENKADQVRHVKHRQFSSWIKANRPDWRLQEKIANKYPYSRQTKKGSFADFYIYQKFEAA